MDNIVLRRKEVKEIQEVFADAGFTKEKPINFGWLEKSDKIQNVLRSLKNHPHEKVFEFVENQLNKWKDQKIERRIRLRTINENRSPREFNDNPYFSKSNQELEKIYEVEVKYDLIQVMNWFKNNVVNSQKKRAL